MHKCIMSAFQNLSIAVDPGFPTEKTTPEEGGQGNIGSIFGTTDILTLNELDKFDFKVQN